MTNSRTPARSRRPREHVMPNHRSVLPLVTVGVALTLLGGCAAPATEADEEQILELAASEVAAVERMNFQSSVTLTGTLNPYRRAEVKAQVPGTVTGLRVDRGDPVTTGQTMATISAEGIRSQAASAAAGVAAVEMRAVEPYPGSVVEFWKAQPKARYP